MWRQKLDCDAVLNRERDDAPGAGGLGLPAFTEFGVKFDDHAWGLFIRQVDDCLAPIQPGDNTPWISQERADQLHW